MKRMVTRRLIGCSPQNYRLVVGGELGPARKIAGPSRVECYSPIRLTVCEAGSTAKRSLILNRLPSLEEPLADIVANAGSGKLPLMTAVNWNNSPAGSLNLR